MAGRCSSATRAGMRRSSNTGGRSRTRATEVVAGFLRRAGVGIAPELLVPTAEMIRAGLAGLVVWWADHPDVPRETIVATAVRLLQPAFAPSD